MYKRNIEPEIGNLYIFKYKNTHIDPYYHGPYLILEKSSDKYKLLSLSTNKIIDINISVLSCYDNYELSENLDYDTIKFYS